MPSEYVSISTPIGRWAAIGPYYAMFPLDFAFRVVQEFSAPGDAVLDPFAGRASSIYAAAAMRRLSTGIEINPVGWVYGQAKLRPARKNLVLRRCESLADAATSGVLSEMQALPEFFHWCFAPRVLRYLLAARNTLRWRTSSVDATMMAILLIYLHGKVGQALSNQSRQGKCMSPGYSVRWWQARGLMPPDVDPVGFLRPRIEWRYAKGVPVLSPASLTLGDSRVVSRRIVSRVRAGRERPFKLLFTSPPYYAVTNYHYDQWLRLWMLGGPDRPVRLDGADQKKFESKEGYRTLLEQVLGTCASMMADDATVYVRTDARLFTYQTTLDVLRGCFPRKQYTILPQPFRRSTQTALYGDKQPKPGEIDIILR